jgi:hypothetical protein
VLRSADSSLFVYGHSLAPNDEHVLRFIEKGKVGRLYVSLYGEQDTPVNRTIIAKSNNPKNLAKVELGTSLLLRRFSAPLRRSVIDFGSTDTVPHIAARKTHQRL